MKTLSKVIMIQWYRMQAVEIPIVGNTAFIGDNGAGKSALLDAIQTVLTGANKNNLVLNRGSNEASSRKLWEYILGVMADPKDPELSSKIKPREKANCYLALNFHDMETNETTCVGLGFYASMADMADKVEGHFICPGLIGTKELFLEPGEHSRPIVLPWSRVKERLAKVCPATRFHHEPGKFTADFYGTMSAHAGSPNNDKTILKALQAAVSLERIANPTEFIRRYMLDRDDLQIKELQSALKNYRDMAEKADSVAKRVSILSRLESHCEKVEAAHAQQVMGEYISLCARIESVEDLADPLRDALADLEESKEELSNTIASLDIQKESLFRELCEKQAEQKNSDIENQRGRLKLEIDQTKEVENDSTSKVSELRRLLGRFENLKNIQSTDALSKAIADVSKLLPGDMVSTAVWPTNPSEVDTCLGALKPALEKGLPVLTTRYMGLCGELDGIDKAEKSLVEMLNQVKHGKAPLSQNTRGLILFLKQNSIEAKPLCDLVDVTNEAWRGTIESILGGKREALIVIPEQVKKAVSLYRHEGRRDFPNCSIVNTMHTDRFKDSRQKGSLVEHLTVENIHARSFVNRQIGNIICVETEKNLLQHDRAATADGMLNTNGLVTTIRPLPPILGRASLEVLKTTYQRELNDLGVKKVAVQRDQSSIGSLKELLDEYKRKYCGDTAFTVETLVACRHDAQQKVSALQKKLEGMASDKREQNLVKEILRLEQAHAAIKINIGSLGDQRLEAEGEYVQTEAKLKSLEVQRSTLQELLKEKRTQPLLDPPLAAETLDRWREQTEGDFAYLIRKADDFVKSAGSAIGTNTNKIIEGYSEYHLKYSVEEGDDSRPEGFENYASVIRKKKAHLEGTTLAEYQGKSARALREAEDTFRAKFVGRLVGKLDAVRNQIAQLNKTLAKHPFHGEMYTFSYSSNPEFKHIIDFAKACNSTGAQEVGGLFDPATNDPNNPHRKALDDITAALQEPKEAERLQDYRNFLVFEVEMRDPEGNRTANLGHRIKKGSGGENQTPFYVAIGASLAAAYRLKEEYGRTYGGMSLALFDEAFSKLSVATCHSCIEFLQNINLQLIVAAPDEKFSTMAEVMDTIVWVTREGGTVDVEVVSIKPAMRAMLRTDNPYRQATGTSGFLNEPT